MRAAWHKLTVLPPEQLEGMGGSSLSGAESSHVTQAGLTAGARVEHAKHGLGMVQSFQGATMGHPLYADGTPLKVKVAFDDGQTHEYKTTSWHKLRVVHPAESEAQSAASEALQIASKSTGLGAVAPGLVVGARVEHGKHGQGRVQHISGLELELRHTKVKVAFDNGETHEYKGGSLDKLRVILSADRDSSVVVAIDSTSATPAPAPQARATLSSKDSGATPAPPSAGLRSVSKVVELVRTPLGLGLSVDKQNKVTAIAGGSQAERSGCFAVHDQVVSLNGQLLSDKYSASFEQQLGTIAAGTKVIIEITPARKRTLLKSKSVLKSTSDLFLKPAQPRQTSPGKMRAGSTVVAEGRVLLEGRMSVRSSGSPFHVCRSLRPIFLTLPHPLTLVPSTPLTSSPPTPPHLVHPLTRCHRS